MEIRQTHDKRDVAKTFKSRLQTLVQRSGLNRSAFASSVGVDRSALTQILSADAPRLPRAETLMRIATAHNVSLDWLLGISHDESLSATLAPAFKLEEAQAGANDALLADWHRQASGTKIRYVPASLPDLFMTDTVISHRAETDRPAPSQIDMARGVLATTRGLQSDMEICMPMQTVTALAHGQGVWSMLDADSRQSQLRRMTMLLDELYPRVRLYLLDGSTRYCAPYTVFGTQRVAIYIGSMYVVLSTSDAIIAMTRHFDQLIRETKIHAHESAAWISQVSRDTLGDFS